MSLPNSGMSFSPFAILTAEEMNDLVENIEALSDGSGLEDEAITTPKLEDGAVTPDKRSSGFKIGTIAGSTLGSTGNKAITGVGFKPKLVRFFVLPTTGSVSLSAGSSLSGIGSMTSSAQFLTCVSTQSPTSGMVRLSSTTACIGYASGAAVLGLSASYVSMDNDGFTVNVTTASSAFDVAYEAYG